MRQRCIGRLRVILGALIILGGDGGVAMSEEARKAAGTSAWAPRDHVRAFYSGHSLSEGVPEVVEQIARSLGHRLDFEVQVLGYSLLRQRTKGEVPSASEWPGYRAGHNRESAGLNVAEELRQPRRLAPGEKYDVLVVTERHDLPAIARKERTAFYLTDMAKHLLTGNPDAEVLLYHTWLQWTPMHHGPGSTTSGRYRQCGNASPAARTSTFRRAAMFRASACCLVAARSRN